MMLGFLLARAGVDVIVLEKHNDFLRDFRGDTIHPSTLELMHELGLLEEFGLAYDLLVYSRHLPVAAEVASRFPGQRFVLDHLAKPDIRGAGALDLWARDLRTLAACGISSFLPPRRFTPVAHKLIESRHEPSSSRTMYF